MRIYIVGAAGSGKTTFAKRASKKTGIECYHLDDIFYADEKGKLRSETERNALFQNIINKPEWIVEDNGSRTCFLQALFNADNIFLLYPNKYIRMKRIISRYIKQKFGFEKCSYKPGIRLMIRMIRGSNSFEIGYDGLMECLSQYRDKTSIFRNNYDITEYINSL